MAALTTARPERGALATTVPSGATIWLSPAPCRAAAPTPRAAAKSSILSAGTSGPTLLAATTNAWFSTARTGTCRAASSRANELRLLVSSTAPRTARARGTSQVTPSMQEYMPTVPHGVSATGATWGPGRRKARSLPIRVCLSAWAATRPAGSRSRLVMVTPPGRGTVTVSTTWAARARARRAQAVTNPPSGATATRRQWSASS